MKRIINVTLAGVAATALALSLGASAPAFAQMKEKEKSVTLAVRRCIHPRTSCKTR